MRNFMAASVPLTLAVRMVVFSLFSTSQDRREVVSGWANAAV